MRSTSVQWTETVTEDAIAYFAPMRVNMRPAQNASRAMRIEDLAGRLRPAVSGIPGRTDQSERALLKKARRPP